MILFQCSACEKILKVPDSSAGSSGKCPSCGARNIVPEAEPKPTEDEDRSNVAAPIPSPWSLRLFEPVFRVARNRTVRVRIGIILAIAAVFLAGFFTGRTRGGRPPTDDEIKSFIAAEFMKNVLKIDELTKGLDDAPKPAAREFASDAHKRFTTPATNLPEPLDSLKAATVGNFKVRIAKFRIGRFQVSGMGSEQLSKEPLFSVQIFVENLSETKKVEYRVPRVFSPGSGECSLTDNFGNDYRAHLPGGFDRISGQITIAEDIYPGHAISDRLIFDRPVDKADYLDLSFPGERFGEPSTVVFRIPVAKIERVDDRL